ncbi:hypothetical protein CGL57_01125 [Edwardsiella anguillarum]|nr:hypothetical protein CGL57_11180 [Edwardsiella anguillarum]RFT04246.1 hypothetical protein CGL57_06685 [Edwardsiella anguillarum]RFT05340.1 hypothetical protein CGL57_01125 [Edwardsiella anguillarum]
MWLIQSGVPLAVLPGVGGWGASAMVRGYARLAVDHLTEYARKIDPLLAINDTKTTQEGK